MEKTCKKLAGKIGGALNYSEEQKAVMAYGFIGLSQFFMILILTAAVGLVFGFFIETLIIFTSVGFLRRTIGGAHSADFYSCIIISVIFVSATSAFCHFFLAKLNYTALIVTVAFIYLLAAYLVYKLAPVASPNKPIKTEAKRKRLRKSAFVMLVIFAVASIFLLAFAAEGRENLISYCSALALSVLWQISLMTKFGHKFMKFLDNIFFGIKRICSGK